MQKPTNIIKHELIGLTVKVTKSKNKNVVGIQGKIIDETRETIKIRTTIGEKIIIKKQSKFQFKLPTGKIVEVNELEKKILEKILKAELNIETIIGLRLILESIRRIGEYGTDIAEIALNLAKKWKEES